MTKLGKVTAGFALNTIGILICLLGVAIVSITPHAIMEIIGGVIVAVGVAMISISKHIG